MTYGLYIELPNYFFFMKYLLFFLALFATSFSFSQSKHFNKYTLSGKVSNLKSGVIYLIIYNQSNQRIVDSSRIINNKFYFSGFLNGYNQKVYIKLDKNQLDNADSLDAVNIPLDNSNMYLYLTKGKFSRYKLTGCKSSDQLNEFNKKNQKIIQKIIQLENDTKNSIKNQIAIKNCYKIIENRKINYVLNNKTFGISPYLLYSIDTTDLKLLNKLYYNLTEKLKLSFYGIKTNEFLEKLKNINSQVGQPVAHLKGRDIGGNLINFDTVFASNKYTLIVFWASWCLPCREENSELQKFYEKYQKLGLGVIGISADLKKVALLDAINSDKIENWRHFESKYFFDTKTNEPLDIENKFLINAYPTKFLIDNKGIIIFRYQNNNNKELSEKLNKLFSNK